jgi:predicted DNA-binding transcriptional regulator AlpA
MSTEQVELAEQSEAHTHDPLAGLPLLIPVPVAAKLLGISRAAAYRFATSGDLPTKKLGRRVYVVSARLRDFLDDKEHAA